MVRARFDLPVLTGAVLNDIQRKPFGVRQQLLAFVAQNRSPVNGVQLTVWASMLTHLARNLEKKLFDWNRHQGDGVRAFAASIQESIEALEELVALGPHDEGPVVFWDRRTSSPAWIRI